MDKGLRSYYLFFLKSLSERKAGEMAPPFCDDFVISPGLFCAKVLTAWINVKATKYFVHLRFY